MDFSNEEGYKACLLAILLLMGGCIGKESGETNNTASKQTEESPETDKNTLAYDSEETDKNESTDSKSNESANSGSDEKSNVSSDSSTRDEESKDPLNAYSNEQNEYARVWFQLGVNQDIDELNIRHYRSVNQSTLILITALPTRKSFTVIGFSCN